MVIEQIQDALAALIVKMTDKGVVVPGAEFSIKPGCLSVWLRCNYEAMDGTIFGYEFKRYMEGTA